MNIFLDLEQTLIVDWSSGLLIEEQCNRIRQLMHINNCDTFTVFSFAVYDDRDRDHFRKSMQPYIEAALNARCDGCLTVQDMMVADRSVTKQSYETTELCQWVSDRGKEDAFRNYIKHRYSNSSDTFVLVDDIVDNYIIRYDLGPTIFYINVDNILVDGRCSVGIW